MSNVQIFFNSTTENIRVNASYFVSDCTVNAPDVIMGVCDSMSRNIALGCAFIFLFWYMQKVIVPRSELIFKKMFNEKHHDFIRTVFDRFYSLNETLAIGFSVWLMILSYIQHGLDWRVVSILITVIILTILAVVSHWLSESDKE